MGTPNLVKFSRVPLPITEALAALHDAFEPLQIQLRKYSRIEPTGDSGLPGYDAVGKLMQVRTVREVLGEVGRGQSFGLAYLVGIPAYIYLNFFDFDQTGVYSLVLTFDSSLLYHTDDDNEAGDLVERILSMIVTTLEVDVCGYNSSDRYWGDFDSLASAEINDGVRSGQLLNMKPPFYYAIRVDHLTTREVVSASSGTAARYKLRATHHTLSAWPR